MFNLGGTELIFLFILALLIFGPKRLPQIGRTIGKGMAEFRKASTELQRAVNTELEEPPAWRTPAAAAAPAAVAPAPPPAPASAGAPSAAAEAPAVAGETAASGEAAIAAALEDFAEQLDEERAAAPPEPTPSRPQ